jgi:hypothetical protein
MEGVVLVVIIAVAVMAIAGFAFVRRGAKSASDGRDEGLKTIAESQPSQRHSTPTPALAQMPSAPPADSMATIEVVEGPDALLNDNNMGRQVPIGREKIAVGRNRRQVNLQLYSLEEPSSVSRLHCTIEFNPALNCFMITDEGSSSGTKVGGRAITPYQPHSLVNDDLIELGIPDKMGAILRFHTAFNPPESGGRIRLDVGIQAKDTIRQHVGPVAEMIRATQPLKSHVFLSYSRKDRDTMRVIRERLEARKIIVWSDEDLVPGAPSWRSDVQNAIENTRCVVALLSPDAKDSEWVNEELNYAKIRRMRIFTVLVRGDESNAIPFGMTGVQWIDMRTDYSEGIEEIVYEKATEQLVASIHEHLGESR